MRLLGFYDQRNPVQNSEAVSSHEGAVTGSPSSRYSSIRSRRSARSSIFGSLRPCSTRDLVARCRS